MTVSVQRRNMQMPNATPGDRTPFHTHRFPVTVYVLEGTFTLELEGRGTVIVKAGKRWLSRRM